MWGNCPFSFCCNFDLFLCSAICFICNHCTFFHSAIFDLVANYNFYLTFFSNKYFFIDCVVTQILPTFIYVQLNGLLKLMCLLLHYLVSKFWHTILLFFNVEAVSVLSVDDFRKAEWFSNYFVSYHCYLIIFVLIFFRWIIFVNVNVRFSFHCRQRDETS